MNDSGRCIQSPNESPRITCTNCHGISDRSSTSASMTAPGIYMGSKAAIRHIWEERERSFWKRTCLESLTKAREQLWSDFLVSAATVPALFWRCPLRHYALGRGHLFICAFVLLKSLVLKLKTKATVHRQEVMVRERKTFACVAKAQKLIPNIWDYTLLKSAQLWDPEYLLFGAECPPLLL